MLACFWTGLIEAQTQAKYCAIMKPEEVIRDRCSNRVGHIVDNGNQIVARDRFGRNLAYYDKQANVTRDRNSNRICQGDALSALILKAAGS